MKSSTFQISVRFTVVILTVVAYILVVRYVTYRLVLDDSYSWGYIDGWRQEPTFSHINADLTSWISGVIIGSIAFAVIVALTAIAFRWVVNGPKSLPDCNNPHCSCIHCNALKRRAERRRDTWLAIAVGTVVGSLISR